MYMAMADESFRYILMGEFAILALFGFSAVIHTISIDTLIRFRATQQQEMIDGYYEGLLQAQEDYDRKKNERIEKLFS